MKAFELPATVSSDGTLQLPSEVATEIPRDTIVRVIILVPEAANSVDDASWSKLAADQFLAGYAEGDDVYDRMT